MTFGLCVLAAGLRSSVSQCASVTSACLMQLFQFRPIVARSLIVVCRWSQLVTTTIIIIIIIIIQAPPLIRLLIRHVTARHLCVCVTASITNSIRWWRLVVQPELHYRQVLSTNHFVIVTLYRRYVSNPNDMINVVARGRLITK